MDGDDELMAKVYRKIEREKALINAATNMRQSTDNPLVQQRVDANIRDGRKNIAYLEEKMRELQLRKMGREAGQQPGSPTQQRHSGGAPPPPPKDGGHYCSDIGYAQEGSGSMPSQAPFHDPRPGGPIPKARPNFSKLDLIKYDTPYLGPKIQLMLSQLEFKLSVEKQYKAGIEKMVRLYQDEGDRKSRADAEGRRVESNQKIQLLKQALKRYEDLHVDIESADHPDDESLSSPNIRKPLTGHLTMRIHAVRDVDHAAGSRFSRGPETFVIMKVEDAIKAKTKATRNDKWAEETFNVDIDKANEIELTVYDKSGDRPTPIGMLWIRLSDIAEEMRRKKIETEFNTSGWVSADKMEHGAARTESHFQVNAPQHPQHDQASQPGPGATVMIDSWFALEPVGRIHLTMSFAKQLKDRRPFDIGLNRQGAVRQKKEEVHEKQGHKFVTQQFYNIMRCALCGDFLKYAAGMQCSDCKYTCHKKCYPKVVTKCISKANYETDPDEEKINHRIPHRFEFYSNISANWCCHCGYLLPFGRKNSKKCSECGLTCHAQCAHLVPDFCGMSMEVANKILETLHKTKNYNRAGGAMAAKTLRRGDKQPAPETQKPTDAFGPQKPISADAVSAAHLSYTAPQSGPAGRPSAPPTNTAAAAAAAAAGMRPPSQQGIPYDRNSTDYTNNRPPYIETQTQPKPPPHAHYDPSAYASIDTYSQPPQLPPILVSQQVPHHYGMQQQTPIATQAPQVSLPTKEQMQAPVPIQQPPKRVGLDHFNFLAVLGKGNFGKVMLAETKTTRKLYAIKVLKKEFIIENDEVESTKSEKRVFLIANKERHPFLLNLHACFQTETRVYFVMEYISGGDLMLHIQRGQFGLKRAQFYAAEVCLALKYFHENGVIYRDLKLDNILLTLDGHIKIGDYGLCKEDMWYGSTTSTFCGTPEFMAPEILLDKKYGRAVDWWAFGVLIYQMLLQQSPFRGEDEDEIYDAILADEPLYPIHMPRDSVSILQKLLTREPELRLGSGPTDAQEIMSHAFFRNINWEDIYHKRVSPPFFPTITSPTDTSNFDQEFTSVTPVLTPVQSVLSQAMQEEFRGFSYFADFV
ncbi:Serine/threonine kinase [Coccidioides posadasii str. Silveira]|uniref:protein kinase C n=1 Tax=Coccidioides posadasii (strain C735) TaxID=222929 RepID=C5PD59_COCP7|nr:Protein kinase C-like, putative [Coccidioides posadasii C735 delta SOWgp]EER25020.1 Protein kinase C-like, putative [Coccidioides posadasii C735 delta SOWgp]QVM12993.1 Serine/threonine kinase [Coccidioides posadasii str. Silveira]|eukprot:XP_003067165.1 Protein kinase C-like, putative [Coccidioides posadasii C735 delta SOWgp]